MALKSYISGVLTNNAGVFGVGGNPATDTSRWYKIRLESDDMDTFTAKLSTRAGDVWSVKIDAPGMSGLAAVPLFKAYKTNVGTVELAQLDYISLYTIKTIRW